ncbi:hypothetical protein SJAG_00140 [Schizosaccharomyces japonicus yFS275]|uniref:CAP-Gly domain-containing protein n=1 Tax=Schizosaccharomyces japonicus (strain yFS275 / FY16936) TaxID=402676 RepID=B6JXJ8_SCHJY|nr:hypothetical protein SJAG_00140 [Schizosaccharomyces japonicus yFS275]EEB05142.1 hypothetical protein SJAG_00140 [Schizosaccharomyces japonicus yFS275]
MKGLQLGSSIRTQNHEGIVRYIGNTSFSEGNWIGVELTHGIGKNDGSVNGKRYFHCAPGKGLFIRPQKILEIVASKQKLAKERKHSDVRRLSFSRNSSVPRKTASAVTDNSPITLASAQATVEKTEDENVAQLPKDASVPKPSTEEGSTDGLIRLKQYKEQIEVLQQKNEATSLKLKSLEKELAENEVWRAVRPKLQAKLASMQETIDTLQKSIRKHQTSETALVVKQQELKDMLELVTLDKELAEERVEQLTDELDRVQMKLVKLGDELATLQNQTDALSSVDFASSHSEDAWIQLETQNMQYHDALVLLKKITKEKEEKLRQELLNAREQISCQTAELQDNKNIKQELQLAEEKVAYLQEQVDANYGQSEMMEELVENNIALKTRIEELVAEISTTASKENQFVHTEAEYLEKELLLKEEIEHKNTQLDELESFLDEQIEDIDHLEEGIKKLTEASRGLREELNERDQQVERLKVLLADAFTQEKKQFLEQKIAQLEHELLVARLEKDVAIVSNECTNRKKVLMEQVPLNTVLSLNTDAYFHLLLVRSMCQLFQKAQSNGLFALYHELASSSERQLLETICCRLERTICWTNTLILAIDSSPKEETLFTVVTLNQTIQRLTDFLAQAFNCICLQTSWLAKFSEGLQKNTLAFAQASIELGEIMAPFLLHLYIHDILSLIREYINISTEHAIQDTETQTRIRSLQSVCLSIQTALESRHKSRQIITTTQKTATMLGELASYRHELLSASQSQGVEKLLHSSHWQTLEQLVYDDANYMPVSESKSTWEERCLCALEATSQESIQPASPGATETYPSVPACPSMEVESSASQTPEAPTTTIPDTQSSTNSLINKQQSLTAPKSPTPTASAAPNEVTDVVNATALATTATVAAVSPYAVPSSGSSVTEKLLEEAQSLLSKVVLQTKPEDPSISDLDWLNETILPQHNLQHPISVLHNSLPAMKAIRELADSICGQPFSVECQLLRSWTPQSQRPSHRHFKHLQQYERLKQMLRTAL